MGLAKKRYLVTGSVLVGTVVVILLAIPSLFGDRLQALLFREASERLEADVSVGRIRVGLIRTFPDLSVRMENLVLTNRPPFQGREFLQVGQLVIRLDLFSLLPGRTPRVKRIDARDVQADLVVSEDGVRNYMVLRPDTASAPGSSSRAEEGPNAYRLDLQNYAVEGLDLAFENLRTGFRLEALDTRHGGSGLISGLQILLDTWTSVGSVTMGKGAVTFLSEAQVDAEAEIAFEAEGRAIRFASDRIFLNEMRLEAEGSMATVGDTLEMDVGFRAPSQSFKSLLSLVPAFQDQGFRELEADGTVEMEGTLAGRSVVGSENLPGLELRARVSDGRILYPDAPYPIRDISLRFAASHPPGSPADATTLEISQARATLDQGGVEGSMSLSAPFTDPNVNLAFQADLDLGLLTAALPLEGMSLGGRLMADVAVAGRRSDFEARRVRETTGEGTIRLDEVFMTRTDWDQGISIRSLTGTVTPLGLTLADMDLQVATSDVTGSGYLQDVIPHLLGESDLGGEFLLRSRFLDLNELQGWLAAASGGRTADGTPDGFVIPRGLDLGLNVGVDSLRYGRHQATDLRGTARIADGALTFEEVAGGVLGGNFALEGSYATFVDTPAQVDLALQLSGVSFGRAFQEVGFMNALAPVLAQATGTFSTGLALSADLSPSLAPALATLNATGTLRTAQAALQSQTTERLASLLGNPSLSAVSARDLIMRFGVENGRLTVRPTTLRLGTFETVLTGSTGLDRSIDYRLSATLPVSGVRLPEVLAATGLNSGSIPVEVRVGGTLSSPTLDPVFGKAIGQVREAASRELSAQALERIRAAEAQGDSLVADAQREADRLRAGARETRDRLLAEAQTRAAALVAEARGNPIAEAGARALADQIIEEANRQAATVLIQADERAEDLVRAADERRASLIAAARDGAGG